MTPMYWKRVATSSRILIIADGKKLNFNQWRSALYLLMKMNKYLPREQRVHVTDMDETTTIKLHHHLYEVLEAVNDIARRYGCMIHFSRDVVYVGSIAHLSHFIRLEAQSE
jgi:hypothetical protein